MTWNIIIEFEIEVLDQFTIGSGDPSYRGANISALLIKKIEGGDGAGGELYLPSSTLKGILRKACNRVVDLVDKNWKPCYEIEPGEITKTCSGSGFEWLEIFGVPGPRSSVWIRFHNLRIVDSVDIYTYTHISIHPDTQTVKEGALYKIEYLPPNTRLRSSIEIVVKDNSGEPYGLDPASLPKYLKLILLSLIEATVIGIGRGSKPFKVRILNKEDIFKKLDEKRMIDDDLKRLIDYFSQNPFEGVGVG